MKKNFVHDTIFAIPVGNYFGMHEDECYIVYAPLANTFFLSTPEQVSQIEENIRLGKSDELTRKVLTVMPSLTESTHVSTDSFCTLHLLLNEKCNFRCSYCYSAKGRSDAELTREQIKIALEHFLSKDRNAVKERTVMFFGGGEPMLSWPLIEYATELSEKIAQENDIKVYFAITTNGSIVNDAQIEYFKFHNFTIQVSFEVLPDVQREQRGNYDIVAHDIRKMSAAGANVYIRSTITHRNVNRLIEMVEHCHKEFPDIHRLSCQQIVDPDYFVSEEIIQDFFDTYFNEFEKAKRLAAEKYHLELISSSSHLISYFKRERFCYNVLCLTPYGTYTTCPDISSPKETGYKDALIGEITDNGNVSFNEEAFRKITFSTIYTEPKCRNCFARWNCGSGCPNERRVYKEEVFDLMCNHYRRMLTHSLMDVLRKRYMESTGKELIDDIKNKLKKHGQTD